MTRLSNSINLKKKIIKLNGSIYEYKYAMSILQLLTYLGFNTKVIVVDYNGDILQKENWTSTKIRTNDSLEILTIAGGG